MPTKIAVTLVDLQLDANNSCLFTYNTCINILYMFRAVRCSSLGGLRRPLEDEEHTARNM
jgi:hypothetical protein